MGYRLRILGAPKAEVLIAQDRRFSSLPAAPGELYLVKNTKEMGVGCVDRIDQTSVIGSIKQSKLRILGQSIPEPTHGALGNNTG